MLSLPREKIGLCGALPLRWGSLFWGSPCAPSQVAVASTCHHACHHGSHLRQQVGAPTQPPPSPSEDCMSTCFAVQKRKGVSLGVYPLFDLGAHLPRVLCHNHFEYVDTPSIGSCPWAIGDRLGAPPGSGGLLLEHGGCPK